MTGSIFLDTTEQSVAETDGTAYVTIVRTGDTSGAVTVTFGLTADNATPGSDYIVPGTNTVIIPAGENYVQVPITITNDALSEPTESFVFSVINVSSGTLLAPRTDRVYILDDENPVQPSVAPPLYANYNVSHPAVITGLNQPIKFEFSPVDASLMYIAEKGGMIKVYNKDTGAFVSNFIDLTGVVNEYQDRGLLDIALHPNFPANPYIYAFYVVDPADTAGNTGNAGPDGGGNRYSYVVRYTADVATNYTTVVPGSGVILVGNTGQTLGDISGNGAVDSTDPANVSQTASDLYDNPLRSDETFIGGFKQNYLKVDSRSHAGGSLAFGPDGMLYVSVGDGISFDFADPRGTSVQDLNSLAGKILRIDPTTGLGLADNPFASGMPLDSNQAKIYQLGLRNPFAMGFDASGRLFISETGWNTWEEINSGPAGANFGWPYYEGGDVGILNQTGDYQDLPSAAAFYAAVQAGTIHITPAYRAFGHSSTLPGYQIQAIVGGDAIYTGSKYPAVFQDDYFFADFSNGNVFSIDTNDRRNIEFLYNAGANQFGPVHFSVGPDGYVYMADLINGQIQRLQITAFPVPAPRSWVATGTATQISAIPIEYRLTIDDSDQLGTVTYSSRLDLRRDFTVSFDAYLGLLDSNGADGIGFMLHNANVGPYAHGDGGGAFGVQGLPNGIGIIIDTYANEGEIDSDKTYFLNAVSGARTTEVALNNMEDGNYHPVVVTWNASTKTLSYTIDGVLRGTLTDANFLNAYLGGSPFAYFGFGGATGGAVNEQRVRMNSTSVIYEHNLTVATDRGDFNGDNRTDFLWSVTDGRAALWLMNGTTITFGDVIGPNPGPTWHIKGTGDYNGDSYSDIVWETDGRRAAIWEMQGTQVIFGDIAGPQVPVGWHIVGTGDFNGDGRSDILWETPDHRAAIWLMNGTQVIFGDIAGPQVAADWHIKATGDFDADGKSDILWQTDSGIAAIWLMNGTTVSYGDIVGPNPGPTWHIKSTGDFNGDAYSDILWQTDTGIAAIWEVKGTQVIYGDIVGPNPGTSWQIKGTGDLNNDGKSDILWQTSTGLPAAWLINGTTVTFGDIIPPNPGTAWQLIGPTG